MIALAIVLLFIPFSFSFAQCKKDLSTLNSFTTQGIIDGPDYYYQNLIVQDIALASQKAFGDISLRFGYLVRYQLDQCRPGQLEVRVYSPEINSSALNYLGFDISSSIRPEKADLVFHLVMPGGLGQRLQRADADHRQVRPQRQPLRHAARDAHAGERAGAFAESDAVQSL